MCKWKKLVMVSLALVIAFTVNVPVCYAKYSFANRNKSGYPDRLLHDIIFLQLTVKRHIIK